MKNIFRLAALSCLLGLSACVTVWKPVAEPQFVSAKDSYTVTLPGDWIEHAIVRDALVITKDGTGLQTIKVIRDDHKLAFEEIEKSTNANMLPQEVAENLIAEIKASYSLDNIDILSNAPATLDGQPGYRLLLEYKTDRGLRRKYLAYGFVNENGLYNLIYEAPTLHYFDRDFEVFEDLVRSFAQN